MKKRILSIILVCVMLVSLLPTFALAAPVYGDTNGHWAADAIDRWSGYGVVNGKGEGSFDPDGQMTRAEAAQVFANLLGLNKEGDISAYPDAQGKWYSEAIAKCVAAGILNGKGAGKMDPNGTITREEFLTMYARAICISNGADATEAKGELSQKGYTDTAKVSDWAADSIGTLVEKGFVNGLTATELAPKANINRASVMALLDQSVSTYVGKDSTETTVAAKSEGITLIANPAVTTVTGTANVVVVAAGAEQYNETTGEVTHNDIRVESAKMPIARVQGENITVTLALSTTADDATVTETGVDSVIVIESTAAVKNAAVAAEGAKIIVKDGAKAESVTVAETAKSASVETAKNATVGTVTIAAESATASVAGKVETVTVAETAKSAAVETKSGSTVGTLNVAAEDAKTTVAGKVETVKVEETAKNVAVETTSTAKVTTVENKAENTAVTGSGSVGAVKSSEDVKIETKNTKVENTSETKEIAVTDSKGTETKVDSGSTGQTTPSAPTGGGGGHSHSYTGYVAISDAQHKGTCACGQTTTANHIMVNGTCSVCGYKADSVAMIPGTTNRYFAKLAGAITEAQNNDVIVLLSDTTENVTIPAGKTLTLNLNGKTLNGGDQTTAENKAAITNNGTLTLTGNGTVKREDTGTPAYYVIANAIGATMTIENATVTNNSGVDGAGSSLVDNAGTMTINNLKFTQANFIVIKNEDNSNLTINGGEFNNRGYYTKSDGSESISSAVQNWGTAEINGGKFSGGISVMTYGSDAKTTINNGNFTNCSIWLRNYKNDANNPVLEIKGGTFTMNETKPFAFGAGRSETKGAEVLTITGGTFSSEPSDYVAPGYEAKGNIPKEGKWTVSCLFAGGAGTLEEPFLIYNTDDFDMIHQMVESGYLQNKSFKLMADIDYSGKVFPAATKDRIKWTGVNFDGNNHKIINADATPADGTMPEALFGNYFYANNTIKDLVIEGSTFNGLFYGGMQYDVDNLQITNVSIRNSKIYDGAFVNWSGASRVEIRNCSLVGSNVSFRGWAGSVGGFIGNGQNLLIEDSSIINSTIESGSSAVGGFICQGGDKNVVIKNSMIDSSSVIKNTKADQPAYAIAGTVSSTTPSTGNSFYGRVICADKNKVGIAGLDTTSYSKDSVWSKYNSDVVAENFTFNADGTITYNGSSSYEQFVVIQRIWTNNCEAGEYTGVGGFQKDFDRHEFTSNSLTFTKLTKIQQYAPNVTVAAMFKSTTTNADFIKAEYASDIKTGGVVYIDNNGVLTTNFLNESGNGQFINNTLLSNAATSYSVTVIVSAMNGGNEVGSVSFTYNVPLE